MTEALRLKYRDEAIIVGAMLLLLGVVCNEFLLERLLAPDGEWGGVDARLVEDLGLTQTPDNVVASPQTP